MLSGDLTEEELEDVLTEEASTATVSKPLTADGIVQIFVYDGERPAEICDLYWTDVNSTFDFVLHFPETFRTLVKNIDELSVTLPYYMQLDNATSNATDYTFENNTFSFTDVPTDDDLTIEATIVMFDFTADDELGGLVLMEDSMYFDGQVRVSMNAVAEISITDMALLDSETLSNMALPSTLYIGEIVFEGGSGRFNPSIDLYDLGSVEITDVPDILTDGSVVVDLYNPQIIIDLVSDLQLGAYISGTLTATKDGATTSVVDIPEFRINAGGETSICICRRADDLDSTYQQVLEVEELSELIRTIPDKIEFIASARADSAITTELLLGHTYTMQPSYTIEAPFAFGEDACIVYRDTVDGWNSSVKDLELSDSTTIVFSTNIESRLPLYLNVEAYAIDVDGNIMEDDFSIEADNTIMGTDGAESAVTPFTVTLTQKTEGAAQRLDGLVFKASADASDGTNSIVGQTLNAEKHFLIANDITVMLDGMMILDLN